MTRPPAWLREKVVTACEGIRTKKHDRAHAVRTLTDEVLQRDATLVRALVEQFVTRKLDQWLGNHASGLDDDAGQLDLFLVGRTREFLQQVASDLFARSQRTRVERFAHKLAPSRDGEGSVGGSSARGSASSAEDRGHGGAT